MMGLDGKELEELARRVHEDTKRVRELGCLAAEVHRTLEALRGATAAHEAAFARWQAAYNQIPPSGGIDATPS